MVGLDILANFAGASIRVFAANNFQKGGIIVFMSVRKHGEPLHQAQKSQTRYV
jgi:hypothetical protein